MTSTELHWYGFFLDSGQSIDVEATTLREAMTEAEQATGHTVVLGRLLDGFDNNGPGRADLAQKRLFQP